MRYKGNIRGKLLKSALGSVSVSLGYIMLQ